MTWFSLVRGLEKGTDLNAPHIPPVDANIYEGMSKCKILGVKICGKSKFTTFISLKVSVAKLKARSKAT